MTLFELIAILLTLSAVFAYLNARYVHLPNTIGVMLISLVASLLARDPAPHPPGRPRRRSRRGGNARDRDR